MRVDIAARYDEPRDALAQSWAAFMADALPLARWMPIPNIGAEAGQYAPTQIGRASCRERV